MPHTSTKIYVDNTVTPKLGIDPADLAAIFVRDTRDYGQNIGDVDALGAILGQINKWAVNKPIRLSQMTRVTDTQKENADYGFDTSLNNPGMIVMGGESALAQMINACISTQKWDNWDYLHPRGLATYNEPYRILDFSGDIEGQTNSSGHIACYNHDAPKPFDAKVHTLNLSIGTATSALQTLSIYKRIDAEVDITKMNAFRQYDIESHHMHLALLTKHGSGNNIRLFYAGSWSQSVGNEAEAQVSARIWQNTNYCMFVYTDIQPEDVNTTSSSEQYGMIDTKADLDDCVTIALPDGDIKVLVGTDYGTGIIITPGWGVSGTERIFQIIQEGDYFTAIIPCVYFASAMNDDAQVTGHVDFMYDDDTSTIVSLQRTITAYIDDEERNNLCQFSVFAPTGHGMPWPDDDFDPTTDFPKLKVRVWWEYYETVSGISYHRYRYWNFSGAGGAGVSEDATPGSIPWAQLSQHQNMYYIEYE